jgi:hypothetical protein
MQRDQRHRSRQPLAGAVWRASALKLLMSKNAPEPRPTDRASAESEKTEANDG